jgi:hypothetical protein
MTLRYYERRVLKAIFKPFLAYLLCVLIVIAAVDRVPDPPFVKPHPDKAAKLCCGGHFQFASDRDLVFEQTLLHALPQAPVFVWSVPCENRPQPLFAACLRQACDSSPPAPAI